LLRAISYCVGHVHKKPHLGIEPGCGSSTLLVANVANVADILAPATFGVFCRLEVLDFDLFFGFLFLCLVLHVV
jgi:hypothetical protein